jgi:hypothetical protein
LKETKIEVFAFFHWVGFEIKEARGAMKLLGINKIKGSNLRTNQCRFSTYYLCRFTTTTAYGNGRAFFSLFLSITEFQ